MEGTAAAGRGPQAGPAGARIRSRKAPCHAFSCRGKWKGFIACLLAVFWAGPVSAAQPEHVVLEKLSQLKNPRPDFKVSLRVNRESYRPGEAIEFYFRSERDCYLTLIDVAAEGVIRVIFPNKHSPDNFVRAGRDYNIPGDYNFKMRVSGPGGTEKIKAIATTEPLDIFEVDFSRGDYFFFEAAPESEVITRGVGGLKGRLKSRRWSEAELEFQIKDAASGTRALSENAGRPAPKPIPGTGTVEHGRMRGLSENETRPAPKPTPGTGTLEHMR